MFFISIIIVGAALAESFNLRSQGTQREKLVSSVSVPSSHPLETPSQNRGNDIAASTSVPTVYAFAQPQLEATQVPQMPQINGTIQRPVNSSGTKTGTILGRIQGQIH